MEGYEEMIEALLGFFSLVGLITVLVCALSLITRSNAKSK